MILLFLCLRKTSPLSETMSNDHTSEKQALFSLKLILLNQYSIQHGESLINTLDEQANSLEAQELPELASLLDLRRSSRTVEKYKSVSNGFEHELPASWMNCVIVTSTECSGASLTRSHPKTQGDHGFVVDVFHCPLMDGLSGNQENTPESPSKASLCHGHEVVIFCSCISQEKAQRQSVGLPTWREIGVKCPKLEGTKCEHEEE
ncbi:uncharacterized protein LOC135414564 [Pseudopipra pipra]|uniref:uncharacterized protein LOC135414564 n=1 Tax=Pseudopipra pipra TaxID=415032 RepID=UPI003139B27F